MQKTFLCRSKVFRRELFNHLAAPVIEPSWKSDFEKVADVIKMATGVSHSLCLCEKGKIHVRGSNYFGQAGFFPQLGGGIGILGDSGDDSIEESLELIEGVKDQQFDDIAVGDYHNLALTNSGQAYCWGAGLLGNGSNLFSSEPILIDLKEPLKHIAASPCRSGVVTRDSNSVYIWGFERDKNGSLAGRNVTPVKVHIEYGKGEISRFLLTDSLFALVSREKVVVCGNLTSTSIAPSYPYNPVYADFKDTFYPLTNKVCLEMDAENILDIQLSTNYLYVLKSDGSASVIDLKTGEWKRIELPEPIAQMAVGCLTASFLARGSKKIYCFAGTFSKPRDVPFLTLVFNWKTSASPTSSQLIPGIPLHEAVLSQPPTVIYPPLTDSSLVAELTAGMLSMAVLYK